MKKMDWNILKNYRLSQVACTQPTPSQGLTEMRKTPRYGVVCRCLRPPQPRSLQQSVRCLSLQASSDCFDPKHGKNMKENERDHKNSNYIMQNCASKELRQSFLCTRCFQPSSRFAAASTAASSSTVQLGVTKGHEVQLEWFQNRIGIGA